MRALQFVTLMLVTLFASVAVGQEALKPILVDEFANILCTDPYRSKIDSFLHEIQQRPNSVGYVVGHADASIPGRFGKYLKAFRFHIRFRGFDPESVKFVRGSDSDKMTFRVWLVPPGAAPPELPSPYIKSPISAPVVFDTSSILSIRKSKVIFGEDEDGAAEPCDWGLDLGHFVGELLSTGQLTGYLIATSNNERSPSFVRKALSLTEKELTDVYKIPAKQVKTIYKGKGDFNELQLWLVPTGSTPPANFKGYLRK